MRVLNTYPVRCQRIQSRFNHKLNYILKIIIGVKPKSVVWNAYRYIFLQKTIVWNPLRELNTDRFKEFNIGNFLLVCMRLV